MGLALCFFWLLEDSAAQGPTTPLAGGVGMIRLGKGVMGRNVRIRTIVLFAAILLVVALGAYIWSRATPIYTLRAASQEPECITPAPNADVLVGLAVSGGGSRAAMFAAAGLEAL